MSEPAAYAYVYPDWPNGEILRFATGGREINGHKPLSAIPLYRDGEGPECERLRAELEKEKAKPTQALSGAEFCPDGMVEYNMTIQNPTRSDPNWPLSSFNGKDWAEEFCKLHPGMDEGLMLTWFSNALMRGYDEHVMRSAKPTATREAVTEYLSKTHARWVLGSDTMDALLGMVNHFAPPASNALILRMNQREIELSMRADFYQRGPGIDQFMSAAATAERLANTPVPEHDPDAEAKSFVEELRRAGFKWHGTVTPYWDDGPEEMRTFARKFVASRAVAAAKKEAKDG